MWAQTPGDPCVQQSLQVVGRTGGMRLGCIEQGTEVTAEYTDLSKLGFHPRFPSSPPSPLLWGSQRLAHGLQGLALARQKQK